MKSVGEKKDKKSRECLKLKKALKDKTIYLSTFF